MTEWPWFFFYIGRLIKIFVIVQIVRVLETYNVRLVRLVIKNYILYLQSWFDTSREAILPCEGCPSADAGHCGSRWEQECLWQQFLYASHAKIVFEICHMTPRSHGNATI